MRQPTGFFMNEKANDVLDKLAGLMGGLVALLSAFGIFVFVIWLIKTVWYWV